MKIDEAVARVKEQLTTKRFDHSLRVAATAKKLAKLYDVNENKAELAGVLHDYAKDFSVDKLRTLVINYSLSQELLQYHHELWHGPVGSQIIQEAYGLSDTDVLDAIAFHTTGRAHMSKLELIIFVADYIEPGRDFPGLDEVRKTAELDLVKAAWMVSRNTMQYLLQRGNLIYPSTMESYNDLTRQL